jgi:Ca-activated chloride channel family protein
MLRDEDFRDDTKDAGEIGAGHTVTALYELIPAGKEGHLGQAEPSKYQQPSQPTETAASGEILTLRLRYKQPAAETSDETSFPVSASGESADSPSGDFRFAAAVACFGMLLRDSEHKGEGSYDLVLELARSGKGNDPHGYRGEFVKLVELAKSIGKRRR